MQPARMKPDDLFAVSVVDNTRSQVVCPKSLQSDFVTHLGSNGIECSLSQGNVTIGEKTYAVEVIITEAGVIRVFELLRNFMQA
jgi:hypothetical protein